MEAGLFGDHHACTKNIAAMFEITAHEREMIRQVFLARIRKEPISWMRNRHNIDLWAI